MPARASVHDADGPAMSRHPSRLVRAPGAVVVSARTPRTGRWQLPARIVSAASEHRSDGRKPGNTVLTRQVVDTSGAHRAFRAKVQLCTTGSRNTGAVSIYLATPHS